MKKRFEWWCPFTARAIGMPEDDIAVFHNKPLAYVMQKINRENPWDCKLVYFSEKSGKYDVIEDGIRYDFYPVSLRHSGRTGSFAREWSIPLLLHLLSRPPDVVALYMVAGAFAIIAALCCRLRAIPYLVVVGGWHVPNSRAYHRYFSNARAVLVPTRKQCDELRKQGFNTDNLHVVPIGVKTELFPEKPLVRRNDQTGGYPRILYVGRINAQKRALETVQMFRTLKESFPSATLKVVGPLYDREYVSTVAGYLEEHSLNRSVELVGIVPHRETHRFFQEADVLVLPSRSECQPFAMIESMACGTPVVAIKGSGPDEIISHGEDGMLVQMPNLTSELISLLQHPETLRQMGQRAAAKIRASYSYERTYRELLAILSEVAST